MSSPKQLARRLKLGRKRHRKAETRRRKQRNRPSSPDAFFDFGPVGPLKMSTVLEDFVDPYVDDTDGDIECYRLLLSTALVAWNAALQNEPQRRKFVDDTLNAGLRTANADARNVARKFIEVLIDRKLRHFSEYERPILNCHVEEQDDGSWYLQVMSALV